MDAAPRTTKLRPMSPRKASATSGVILLTAVALLSAAAPAQQLLHFNISGTLDTPRGVFPLSGSQFTTTFDLSSDPTNLILTNEVALYAAVTYSNGGITVSDPNALIEFFSGGRGGIYVSFNPTNSFPDGFALDIYQGAPVLYSGTEAEPHFSPGIIDLRGARLRVATLGAGGAGYPFSWISSPVLAITVPEPAPFVLGLLGVALLHGRLLLVRRGAEP
jgi:hypothetical protein